MQNIASDLKSAPRIWPLNQILAKSIRDQEFLNFKGYGSLKQKRLYNDIIFIDFFMISEGIYKIL